MSIYIIIGTNSRIPRPATTASAATAPETGTTTPTTEARKN